MNQLPPELAQDAPLDPAAERVRRKMVRLLAVSIGIMFVGLFAVLAAIVWQLGEAARPAPAEATLVVPDGFAIVESGLAADGVMLRGTGADGVMLLLVFDRSTGVMVGRYRIAPEPVVSAD